MRWLRIKIGTHDIRFDLVTVNCRLAVSVMDRVEQRKQFSSSVAIAQHGEGQRRPNSTMRILPAILANARRITFDIAGIARRMVKWRGEQQQQFVVPADEIFV